jgi:hypothetical protein
MPKQRECFIQFLITLFLSYEMIFLQYTRRNILSRTNFASGHFHLLMKLSFQHGSIKDHFTFFFRCESTVNVSRLIFVIICTLI